METKFFEEVETKLFFFKKRKFIFDVTLMEASAFGMIFSTATIKLKEWYEKNKSSAASFELRLSSTPLVLDKAMKAMVALRQSVDSYDFVKKLSLTVVFQNTDTGEIATYDCDKA